MIEYNDYNCYNGYMKKNQKGQLILTLILVMTVALAIGLSIVQKSLVDVSTATKVEQSSRAFSAAEAGIEKALKSTDCGAGGVNCNVAFTENDSSATVSDSNLIPAIAAVGTQQDPLEYPPLAKEDVAHVWLADLNSTSPSSPPTCGGGIACFYTALSIDIFWGNSNSDKAALELTIVYFGTDPVDGVSKYLSLKKYYDHALATRSPANNFEPIENCSVGGNKPETTDAYKAKYGDNSYQCKVSLSGLPAGLILMRARLLYNTQSQPFAVQPPSDVKCGPACSIPPQARVLVSSGVSGETQRKVKLFQLNKVVPPYFDYAIFSAGEINK